ncbi:hypothetical protein FORMB_24800 [Formosa sp. Hel1_33_131]|uniref:hypothetical protein n=1 Tax=Formosa sp. Hel1_33_131 TaxID=1336794 RepID=UPI00084E1502|nr:hypothetical protein [Formosa sp. Hel1_33_131]AOR29497.1 hypothetical protein FORMB_24800 [Formosa sp. Hel1_33_131]
MKKLVSLLSVVLFMSCVVEEGIDGRDGGLIVSSAFEIVVDFNPSNNYEIVEPYGFDVFEYDVTLVYILWETDNGQDVWRLLPQSTIFVGGATLTYNFDFTQTDVKLFLEGTANFDNLSAVWTQDVVFRIVVVPADNVSNLSNPEMTDFDSSLFQKRD